MALAIDGTPASSSSAGATSSVTGTLTTTGTNEIVLALISNATVTGMAVSGAGLTWTLVPNTDQNLQAADNSWIFWAFAASTVSSQTITAQTTSGTGQWLMTLVSLSGVDTGASGANAIGASNGGGGTAQTPSISLTTTRNGSWVFGVIGIGSNVTMTAGTNQTIFSQVADTVNGGHEATLKQNATTATSGTSVPISITNTNQTWNGACVEILPATGVNSSHMMMMGMGM